MIANYNPVTQALLGTLFTWGVTALGSALVFIFNSGQVKYFCVFAHAVKSNKLTSYVPAIIFAVGC